MAIIGILAAVIIPNVMTFMTTGKLNAARTEAENVKTAGLAYYADYSVWPPDPGQPAGATNGDIYNTAASPNGRSYINKVTIGGYTWDQNTGALIGGSYPGTTFTWSSNNETWMKP